MRPVYPFSAIVGQHDMRLALLATAIDPMIGGVLVLGDRGTGKSTAVRGLAGLLPKIRVVAGCAYNCDPAAPDPNCAAGCAKTAIKAESVPVPVIDLPLGATEDRVVGTLDLERALSTGEKSFEPGLLARANRGYLYIDEVNLLEDHLVDLLLDVAASGENLVEREGLSIRHPARFVLIGSGNPEEGELRPQLLDRFGLSVDIRTPTDIKDRVEVIRRRERFERDPTGFCKVWARHEGALRQKILKARDRLALIDTPDHALEQTASLCISLGTDGLRGELTLIRAARALAAYEEADKVATDHLRRMAGPALRHRLRRDPLDEAGSDVRVTRAVEDVLG